MRNLSLLALVAACALSGPTLAPSIAFAAPNDPVCVQSTTSEGQPFVIVVSEGRLEELAARGFVEVDCQGRENSLPEYRRQICEFAAKASPSVEAVMSARYGLTPTELCDIANEM